MYKFKAEVWLWPGVGGWHFVNVPDEISVKIRKKSGKGMIKVVCHIKSTKWDTSLFPLRNQKGVCGYILCLKKSVRDKEKIFPGDKLSLSFKVQ